MLMWNDFFRDAATNQKREIFLVEPVSSLKLACYLKHISCKQFHKIVKSDSTFLVNLQNIHGLDRLSK